MAYTTAILLALAVAVIAEPIRYRRSTEVIQTQGSVAGIGDGAAGTSHAEHLAAQGDSGWTQPGSGWGSGWGSTTDELPAHVIVLSDDLAVVQQGAVIAEVTDNNGADQLLVAQSIGYNGEATSIHGIAAHISGLNAQLGQSSNSNAQGSGASSAEGTLDMSSSP